jgi:hypothetical protein
MSTLIPITVALIGALVSIVAAFIASRGATSARKSSEALNSRTHRIARLDAQASELREAYKAYLLEFGRFESTQLAAPTMVTLEVLIACQAVTPELEKAALQNSSTLALAAIQRIFRGIDPTPVRIAYQDAQKLIADKREAEATDKD